MHEVSESKCTVKLHYKHGIAMAALASIDKRLTRTGRYTSTYDARAVYTLPHGWASEEPVVNFVPTLNMLIRFHDEAIAMCPHELCLVFAQLSPSTQTAVAPLHSQQHGATPSTQPPQEC
jgi:hypothetical protein